MASTPKSPKSRPLVHRKAWPMESALRGVKDASLGWRLVAKLETRHLLGSALLEWRRAVEAAQQRRAEALFDAMGGQICQLRRRREALESGISQLLERCTAEKASILVAIVYGAWQSLVRRAAKQKQRRTRWLQLADMQGEASVAQTTQLALFLWKTLASATSNKRRPVAPSEEDRVPESSGRGGYPAIFDDVPTPGWQEDSTHLGEAARRGRQPLQVLSSADTSPAGQSDACKAATTAPVSGWGEASAAAHSLYQEHCSSGALLEQLLEQSAEVATAPLSKRPASLGPLPISRRFHGADAAAPAGAAPLCRSSSGRAGSFQPPLRPPSPQPSSRREEDCSGAVRDRRRHASPCRRSNTNPSQVDVCQGSSGVAASNAAVAEASARKVPMRGPERFFYDTSCYTGCARFGGPKVIDKENRPLAFRGAAPRESGSLSYGTGSQRAGAAAAIAAATAAVAAANGTGPGSSPKLNLLR
eukprot:TRINITY_DN17059_c0_g1_i4.p1 TRINITY_DN17059_c0_g1~~TRINITY_DN17059_c0_g1_i4.p1  ORF type:complete len:475 (+),score=90.93 TRINITY_DN17059_c0_g1_i4:78-1502(+)